MSSFAPPTPDAVPIWFVAADAWDSVKEAIGGRAAAFAEACGFKPKAGRLQLVPGEGGALAGVLFGVEAAGRGRARPVGRGEARDQPAGGRLSLRQSAGRCRASPRSAS